MSGTSRIAYLLMGFVIFVNCNIKQNKEAQTNASVEIAANVKNQSDARLQDLANSKE